MAIERRQFLRITRDLAATGIVIGPTGVMAACTADRRTNTNPYPSQLPETCRPEYRRGNVVNGDHIALTPSEVTTLLSNHGQELWKTLNERITAWRSSHPDGELALSADVTYNDITKQEQAQVESDQLAKKASAILGIPEGGYPNKPYQGEPGGMLHVYTLGDDGESTIPPNCEV